MSLLSSSLSSKESGGKKLYYAISEVAKITGVEQHVIRYWESEFPKLRPKKGRSGNRQFKEKDIQIIRYIKHLLHTEMYTIQGAKKRLSESDYKEMEGQINLLSTLPQASANVNAPQIGEVTSKETAYSQEAKKVLPSVLQELREVKKLLT